MDDYVDLEAYVPLLLALVIGAVLCVLTLWPSIVAYKGKRKTAVQPDDENSSGEQDKAVDALDKQSSSDDVTFSHTWLASTIKGHKGFINSIDSSLNGKYLATSSEDGTCILWGTRDLEERTHKSIRCQINEDCPSVLKFTPDSRGICVALRKANTLRVFSATQLTGLQKADQFPRLYDVADLLTFSFAPAGRYVLFAYTDSRLQVVSLRGEILSSFDSLVGRNLHAAVSPCSRYIAACGASPVVRVWQAKFATIPMTSKSKPAPNAAAAGDDSKYLGIFVGVVAAYSLHGHKDSVSYVNWSSDCSRIATVSRDATWRIYKITESDGSLAPTLLISGTHSFVNRDLPLRAAYAPDGLTLAISSGGRAELYDSDSGSIRHVEFDFAANLSSAKTDGKGHASKNQRSAFNDCEVRALTFSCASKFFLVACGNRIHALYNVVGARVRVRSLERRGPVTTDLKERDQLAAELALAHRVLAALEKKLARAEENGNDSEPEAEAEAEAVSESETDRNEIEKTRT